MRLSPAGTIHEQTAWCIDQFEGGWSDHPHDTGGATSMGMTKVGWADYSGHAISTAQLSRLTPSQLLEAHVELAAKRSGFYRIADWRPRLIAIDWAIHSSRYTVVPMVQRAVGARIDGKFGTDTDKKANTTDPLVFAVRLLAARQRFHLNELEKKPKKRVFARGWWDRCATLLTTISDGGSVEGLRV